MSLTENQYKALRAEGAARNRRTKREAFWGRVLLYVLAAGALIVALASAGAK